MLRDQKGLTTRHLGKSQMMNMVTKIIIAKQSDKVKKALDLQPLQLNHTLSQIWVRKSLEEDNNKQAVYWEENQTLLKRQTIWMNPITPTEGQR